jgi:hypothetical protein
MRAFPMRIRPRSGPEVRFPAPQRSTGTCRAKNTCLSEREREAGGRGRRGEGEKGMRGYPLMSLGAMDVTKSYELHPVPKP